jgi:hypothetical protein
MTPFVQAAYLVPQAADAAEHWAREFGAGPFFLSEHIPLKAVVYRGSPGSTRRALRPP